MKKYLIKFFCLTVVLTLIFSVADAQKTQKKRAATKRGNTTTKILSRVARLIPWQQL